MSSPKGRHWLSPKDFIESECRTKLPMNFYGAFSADIEPIAPWCGTLCRKLAEGLIVFEEPFNIVVIPGKGKLDQVTLPPEKDPGFNPLPNLSVISHQPLEPQPLVDLPVLGKYIDQLSRRLFDFRLIRRMKRFD